MTTIYWKKINNQYGLLFVDWPRLCINNDKPVFQLIKHYLINFECFSNSPFVEGKVKNFLQLNTLEALICKNQFIFLFTLIIKKGSEQLHKSSANRLLFCYIFSFCLIFFLSSSKFNYYIILYNYWESERESALTSLFGGFWFDDTQTKGKSQVMVTPRRREQKP